MTGWARAVTAVAALTLLAGGLLALAMSGGAPATDSTPAVPAPAEPKPAEKTKKQKPKKPALPPPDPSAACPNCNVILISIDTLRGDHLSSNGYHRKTSPAIDRLAAESLVFENAISQSTWTTPAHASMMTGLLPSEHKLLMYPKPGRLEEGTPTIASLLAKRGYRTVSYNGGGYVRPVFGLDAGFQIYKSRSRMFPKNIEASKKWLKKHGDERFFLFLHGFDVHRPYIHDEHNTFHEPKKKYDMRKFCRFESRPRKGDELAYIIAQYDAGIVYVDGLLGDFFDFLRAHGLMDRSIVIITSDHGDEFFEHGGCDHKHSVYRELVHVPLIVRVPNGEPARIAAPVPASTSLLPTVMHLLGHDVDISRESGLHHWIGPGADTPPVISETGRWRRKKSKDEQQTVNFYRRGLTAPSHKLIYNWVRRAETLELYDSTQDPYEQHDRSQVDSALAASLRERLFAGGAPGLPEFADPTHAIDPETEGQIRALGYVQ